MNSTNRPVDILLNIESPSINLAKRRNSAALNNQGSELSALNRKGNSFEEVYRQQRREDAEVRQPSQQKRSADTAARPEHRSNQAQQNTPVKQAKAADKSADNGKPLPQASDNHGQKVSAVAKGETTEEAAEHGQKQTEGMADDANVATTIKVSDLASSSDDASFAVGQQEGELTADLKETPAEETDSVSDAQAADVIDGLPVDSEQLAKEAVLAENDSQEAAESQTAATEQALTEEQALPDEESAVLQTRQSDSEQKVTAKNAENEVSARSAQPSTAAAEAAREFKQYRTAGVADNTVAGDINTPTAAKAAASNSDMTGQPSQDRLAQLTAAMDFKALREQLAAGTVKVDGSTTAAKAAGVGDAINAAESAADRLPRLNSLSQASQALTPAKAGIVSASVQTPVGSPEWGQAMSQRIMWLANRGISAAELQLNPRDLGPVDVRISVSGEQATVQFSSQQAGVREALESSVVRLREMMESGGLNLADVDVSDQSHSEHAQADAGDGSARNSTGETDDLAGAPEAGLVQQIESDGLVDFYA